MPKRTRWENIFPATCTPLNDDYSVNEGELRRYVRWLASFELIDGLVCNGHTGEITSFNREERKRITQVLASEVGDQVAVISGVSAEGTFEAVDHARDAQEAGAAGILLMPPHTWLRFGMKQEAVIKYFRDVAEAIDIGIIIHLYPFGTKAFYPVETVVELARIPNVKTLKMGTRHMALYERDVRILRRKAPELSILTCMDEFILSSMYVGVDGALIGFGACIPELITEAWKAVKDNDFPRTRELQEQIFPMAEAIYGIGEPSGDAHARMKEALKQRGVFSSALMRPPLLPLTEEEKAKVSAAIRNLKQPHPAGWEKIGAGRR
jgi:4-hydroxy-tetrahydrodipicolinate synthase